MKTGDKIFCKKSAKLEYVENNYYTIKDVQITDNGKCKVITIVGEIFNLNFIRPTIDVDTYWDNWIFDEYFIPIKEQRKEKLLKIENNL